MQLKTVVEIVSTKAPWQYLSWKSFLPHFYDLYFLKKYGEQIVHSSVSCNITLDPQRMEFS